MLTKLQTVVLMLHATVPGDLITANANQDLLKMDGLAKVKQGPVSESNVKSVLVLKLIAVTTF